MARTAPSVVDRKYGWYGIKNDNTESGQVDAWRRSAPKKPAHLSDTPGWSVTNMVWEYEAAAVCRKPSPDTPTRKGDPEGTVYAVVTWGFDVSPKGKITKHKIKVWNKPSARQLEAVDKWNQQARGELAVVNDPDQEELPDLR